MAKKAKKSTARKPTKKAKVRKGKKAVGNGALLKAAREILPRLKSGSTTLSAERDKLGLKSNGPLRQVLTKLLGGKTAYQKMMKAAQAARPESRGSGDTAAVDDSDVPHQKGGKGWVQIGTVGKGDNARPIFRDPKGQQWAEARPDEPAELIIEHKTNGLTPTRLYKLKAASKAKKQQAGKTKAPTKKAKRSKKAAGKRRKAA